MGAGGEPRWPAEQEIAVEGCDDRDGWLEQISLKIAEGSDPFGAPIDAGTFHIQRMLELNGSGTVVSYLDEPARGRFPQKGLSRPTPKGYTPLEAAKRHREQLGTDLVIIDAGDLGFPRRNALVAVCRGPDDDDAVFYRDEPANMPE